MQTIDFRSDTVTQPTPGMRKAMMKASVGDDVYGEDPSVNRLEAVMAERLQKEAALWVASGTQSNLLALFAHCERGDEYIAGQLSHIYRYEGGGGAVLASIQPQAIDNQEDGTLDLNQVASVIKDRADSHFAKTRLLCLENTNLGRVLPLDYLHQAQRLASQNELAMHLDGARLFNASVSQGVEAAQIANFFDSISVCLSKGLGAPVGSMLVGSKALIEKARRWRKVVGGGMRQAGFLAQAGLYALEHHVERLRLDHAHANYLATRIKALDEVELQYGESHTNMLFMRLKHRSHDALQAFLSEKNIQIRSGPWIRLVLHLDISRDNVDYFLTQLERFVLN